MLGAAQFSAVRTRNPFELLKNIFITVNFIVLAVVVLLFSLIFLSSDDDQEFFIRWTAYFMCVLFFFAAGCFLFYGSMIWKKLSTGNALSNNGKSTQTKLQSKILRTAVLFACAFSVESVMWLLSVEVTSTYIDNFTVFNSIFLTADVLCLVVTLSLYRRAITLAKASSKERASTSNTSTLSNRHRSSGPGKERTSREMVNLNVPAASKKSTSREFDSERGSNVTQQGNINHANDEFAHGAQPSRQDALVNDASHEDIDAYGDN